MSLASLAFPYEYSLDADISVRQVDWINQSEKSKITVSVGSSIKKDVGVSGENDLLNFVENYNDDRKSQFPFLLKIDTESKKLDLHLNILSQDETPIDVTEFRAAKDQKSLLLMESIQDVDLQQFPTDSLSAISVFEYSKLDISSEGHFIIEKEIPMNLFVGEKIIFSIWETNNSNSMGSGVGLMKFSVWLDSYQEESSPKGVMNGHSNDKNGASKQTSFETISPKTVTKDKTSKPLIKKTRPIRKKREGNVFNFSIEDGPLFRSTLAEYENKLPIFKNHLNDLFADLKQVEKILNSLIVQKFKFMENFEKVLRSHFENNMLFETFFQMDDLNISEIFIDSFSDMFDEFERKLRYFLGNIISPTLADNLCKYNNSISHQKKFFEASSKEYYTWLNKYLSSNKEKSVKLFNKTKAFELSKFDYLNYLLMIIHNPHITLFFNNVLIFVQMENRELDLKSFRDFLLNLDTFSKEKAEFRKQIDAANDSETLSKVIERNSPLACVSNTACSPIASPTSPNEEPLPNDDSKKNYKAGILFTLGGQGKQGWHKHWIVLNEGVLTEYSDWRKGQTKINCPIEIALSSIKTTTYDKRLHCFEIITSTGDKHVFQATSERERDLWIKALYNAGQQINVDNRKPATYGNEHGLVGAPKGNHKTSKHNGVASPNEKIEEDRHYQLVQNLDKSNLICVDCGSTDAVEWISINFLVVFCLKCSSCHRNLGSHITKIRSLKLDNFSNESEALLSYINNAIANSYLESKLPVDAKLNQKCTDAERLSFISDKYLHKKYCSQLEKKNEELAKAVQNSDVASALKSISCGANVNTTVHINGDAQITVSVFEYSLRKPVVQNDKVLYVLSELLISNGANIGKDTHGKLEFSESAKLYWANKLSKLHGIPMSNDADTSSSLGSSNNSIPRSMSSKKLLDNFKRKKST